MCRCTVEVEKREKWTNKLGDGESGRQVGLAFDHLTVGPSHFKVS